MNTKITEKQSNNFFAKIFSFSFFTFISRIFGLARDTVIAYKIGASAASDIFFVALKAPNFFRALFAEGAFTQAFIPIYNQVLKKDQVSAKKFCNNIFYFMIIALTIFVILLEIYMDKVMFLFAPGFSNEPEKFNHLVFIARITFPYLIFISLCCIYSAILNSFHKYSPTAIVPIISNLFLIIGVFTLFDYTQDHVLSLALAFVFSGIIQLIYLIYHTHKINIKIKPQYTEISSSEKTFSRKIIPAIIGASIIQINIWIDTIFASMMSNVVSYYNYAERLINLPVALVITSITIVLLPSLTKAIQSDNKSEISKYNKKSIHLSILLITPAASGLFMLAMPIVFTLFSRGEFNLESTIHTAIIIKTLAVYLPAICLMRIINTNFFARSDTKTPMKVAFLLMILNIIFNYILVKYFGYIGIALSTSIITWIGVFISFTIVSKKHGNLFKFATNISFYLKILIANILMIIALFYFKNNFFSDYDLNELERIVNLTILMIIGFFTYLISLICFFGSIKKLKKSF
ncbi:MAG: murein biosynthesis integral membrane protein MurJ [Rickettsiales bacterium]|nr:murein biosynthesis integral membrane protein MurJ [Rickettsiales bacterium]